MLHHTGYDVTSITGLVRLPLLHWEYALGVQRVCHDDIVPYCLKLYDGNSVAAEVVTDCSSRI